MKLNAIKTACLQDKHIIIYTKRNGEQWIGNRRALWPVEGITIHEGNIPAIFDLDDKQMSKLYIREKDENSDMADERITRDPMPGHETHCKEASVCIWYKGCLYRPIYTEQGVMLMDISLLKPAENKDGYMEFHVRQAQEGGLSFQLIACYGSLFVDALIVPESREFAEEILAAARVVVDMPLAETWTMNPEEETTEDQTEIPLIALCGDMGADYTVTMGDEAHE